MGRQGDDFDARSREVVLQTILSELESLIQLAEAAQPMLVDRLHRARGEALRLLGQFPSP